MENNNGIVITEKTFDRISANTDNEGGATKLVHEYVSKNPGSTVEQVLGYLFGVGWGLSEELLKTTIDQGNVNEIGEAIVVAMFQTVADAEGVSEEVVKGIME